MARYIDADNLSKAKYHNLPYTHIVPNCENVESYERGWNDAIDAIIENEPTADVRENVKGENNAEVFKSTFGIYATELWSMEEKDFLEWLNSRYER